MVWEEFAKAPQVELLDRFVRCTVSDSVERQGSIHQVERGITPFGILGYLLRAHSREPVSTWHIAVF
jgi:hypothetical protein